MPFTLYISYDGMTDPLGQSQVIPYLKELSNSGFNIILISFEKKSRTNEIKSIRKDLISAGIIWKPLRYHKSPALPATLLDIFIGTYFIFIYCKKYKVQIVHCRSYIAAFMAYLVKFLCGFRNIFDMRGFWADERIEGDIWHIDKFIHKLQYQFFKFMEKKFIEQSDRVITLTEAAKKYIENHFKLKREIAVIPCSTDLTLFSRKTAPADDEELTKARQEEKTILVYLGSIGTWYLLDRMLQFFKIMKEIKPAVFLIITPNSREAIIEEAGKMGIISSDLIVRKSIRSDIPKWLSSADAGIFFIKPVFSKTASSPVKHGEMMACELPVVTNAGIGDVDDIITKSDTGVIVHDWEEETLKRAAKKLFELIVEEDRSRYQAAANQYYSLMSASARYLNIYRELSK